MTTFRPARGGGVWAVFEEADAALLAELLEQLLGLLDDGDDAADAGGRTGPAGPVGSAGAGDGPAEGSGPADGPGPADPLFAELGIGTSVKPPQDPALARLLPDGYRDDPEAAADFRRYTEVGLRAAKRASARTALATLAVVGRRQLLTAEQAQAWLRTLNDLRLALGTRLGVGESWEEEADALPEGDPRYYGYAVYDHLTWLQESLVQSLLPRAR